MSSPGAPEPAAPGRVTITVPAWVAALRDAGIQAAVALVVLAGLGFGLLAVGWAGAARTIYVPFQLPWFISGGLLALAVIGLALGAWSIHLGRRADAEAREEFSEFVEDFCDVADRWRVSAR